MSSLSLKEERDFFYCQLNRLLFLGLSSSKTLRETQSGRFETSGGTGSEQGGEGAPALKVQWRSRQPQHGFLGLQCLLWMCWHWLL